MNNAAVVLQCENISRTYQDGHLNVEVIRHLNLIVHQSESICIRGASGSGKSTLLHLLGGLDHPNQGRVLLCGKVLGEMSPSALGQWRNRHLGFVYQFHHLLPEFSALENVMMPLLIAKKDKKIAEETAAQMLTKVGLAQRLEHRPAELSGGERQRAAIARALVMHPSCVLADEPTGNLDKENANIVLDLMMKLKEEMAMALIVVTHDDDAASRFDRVLRMDEGYLHPVSNAS